MPEFLLAVLLLLVLLTDQGGKLRNTHVVSIGHPRQDVAPFISRRGGIGVIHAQTSTTESASLLFDYLVQELRRVFSILALFYPLAKDTPILDDSLLRLKKSSKEAKS
jgi:hypothetical protein